MLRRGSKVAVLVGSTWLPGIVDAPSEYGWIGVSGVPGFAGVTSFRVWSVTSFYWFAKRG